MAYLEIILDGKMIDKIELQESITVLGRKDSANIVLSQSSVSGKHAQILREEDRFRIEDLDSLNGTLVNEKKIQEYVLKDKDVIRIGEYSLKFFRNGENIGTEPDIDDEKDAINVQMEERIATDDDVCFKFKRRIRDLLIERMNLKKLVLQETDSRLLEQKASARLDQILEELSSEIPSGINKKQLKKQVIDDTLGLGPLEDLLNDASVTEIMVNKYDQIYIEQSGKLHLSKKRFFDDAQVMAVIQRIVAPLGRAINESTPIVDARLADGSRVNAIIPPLALQGPTLTIRKFSKKRLTTDDLVNFGSLDQNMVEFLKLAVKERKNIIISGGTGSGKTTLLNILSGFIPPNDRIITVEDAAELSLPQEHVVSLEARPPNIEGKGAIPIRELVKNCLRMRPDRIVVGECRGGEALDMLQAMNTGHDGSLTTAHANSPRDVISRLETMVLMAGMDLPVRAIREQIESAVNLIVQQSRLPDGSRKVTYITEVTGITGEIIALQDIFFFRQTGFDNNGMVTGNFQASGVIPNFVKNLQERGITVNLSIFEQEKGKM